jgi:hypothetical protein
VGEKAAVGSGKENEEDTKRESSTDIVTHFLKCGSIMTWECDSAMHKNNLRVFVITSDKYLWTISPFAYLFNVYFSALQPVVVAGYSLPQFNLPRNFTFHSLDRTNYPPEKWSDGLIKFLQSVPDDYFILLLEDYWLIRTVDHGGLGTLYDLMINNANILKIDLTTDRLHAYGDARYAKEAGSYGHYDIVQTFSDVQYQMSLQAAIWNKRLMLELLQPGKSPWDVEIFTSVPDSMAVLGTRQWPLRYCNAMLKGKLIKSEIEKIPDEHRLRVLDMIPKDIDFAND